MKTKRLSIASSWSVVHSYMYHACCQISGRSTYSSAHCPLCSSSSSRACPWLERSHFHKLLPTSSVLGVSPCWVQAMIERLKVGPSCDTDVLGGASNPRVTRELTYVTPWRGHASRPSVPHAQRNGDVLFGWAATAVVESRLEDGHPVAAANLWNGLPSHVTAVPSLSILCCRLKSHLFSLSYPALWLFSHLYSPRTVTRHFGHYNRYYI